MDSDVSWAVLLAHWTDFARASVALPDTADAKRWKQCISDVIGLQAITFALSDLRKVASSDRAGAIDRAELGVRDHASRIHQAWEGVPLPEGLSDLIADARRSVAIAGTLGTEWVVGRDRLVMDVVNDLVATLLARAFRGDLFVAPPGTVLFAGSPAVFASGWIDDVDVQEGMQRRSCAPQRQVYRQTDSDGCPTRDLVRLMHEALPAGLPLLVPVLADGRVVRTFDQAGIDARRAAQNALFAATSLPVVEGAPDA